MQNTNPSKRQGARLIILPMLASDTAHQHLVEVLTPNGQLAGKA
jgi:hypothetical protein